MKCQMCGIVKAAADWSILDGDYICGRCSVVKIAQLQADLDDLHEATQITVVDPLKAKVEQLQKENDDLRDKNSGCLSSSPSYSLNLREGISLIKTLAECKDGRPDDKTRLAVIVAVCDEILSIDTFNEAMAQTRTHVSVSVFANYPACLDAECPHKRECANHTSAGDYRSEDGATPDLVRIKSGWQCSRCPEYVRHGAVLIDGTYMNDWRL